MGTDIKRLLPNEVYQNLTSSANSTLIGRYSVGSGRIQQITLGAGLSLSVGGVLSATGGGGGGTVTSVGLSMPSAFTVSNSPVVGAGTLTVVGAGTTTEYIRGDGTLASFPSSGGAGGGTSYYFNGGTSQGTLVGNPYFEMNRTAVVGVAADFTLNLASPTVRFITDIGDPNQISINGGNWIFQIFMSLSSNGGAPTITPDVYKYDGVAFTLLATGVPEAITNGTTIDLYSFAVAIPPTTLLSTDRIAITFTAATLGGRDLILYTQDSRLAEVVTTFSSGLNALNGLTSSTQYFAVGTTGLDFNISSVSETHTFNLPTASATVRGALSAADWSTFNSKQASLTFSTGLTDTAGTITNNLSTGIAGGQSIYGGAAASENLTISSTINATKGVIELAKDPLHAELVTIGSVTNTAGQGQLRIGKSGNYMDLGALVSGPSGGNYIWIRQSTPSSTNYVIFAGNSAGDVKFNLPVSSVTSKMAFTVAGTDHFTYRPFSTTFLWTPVAVATTTPSEANFTFTSPANTIQTASAETVAFKVNLSNTIEHDTGAIATQRDMRITNRTHTFIAASIITDAHTVQIDGATVGGTNATITNSNAFTIASAVLTNVTNSYGLTVNAQTGGTNNYTARFLSGNVGILTSAPNSSLHVAGSVATGWRAISVADSFTSTDFTIESSGAAAYNVTLPTAVGITGRIYVLKNVSGGIRTLATTSSQTIDGALTREVTATNNIMIQSNGTNWIIIG